MCDGDDRRDAFLLRRDVVRRAEGAVRSLRSEIDESSPFALQSTFADLAPRSRRGVSRRREHGAVPKTVDMNRSQLGEVVQAVADPSTTYLEGRSIDHEELHI